MNSRFLPTWIALLGMAGLAYAQSPYQSSTDFARYAMKLRENALLRIEPQVVVPTTGRPWFFGETRYAWKTSIRTTVFWVGERPTPNNPTPNTSSSWDPDWEGSFGGFDNPDPLVRRNYLPPGFVPRQNPFYFALPYNDVMQGTTKPEAYQVIPWLREIFERPGKSVCRDRWIAIRHGNRVAYAQWSDCGPFRTDHWQYVFGDDRPKPNMNGGAGLDVSPAVRDYLGMAPTDVTDWRFVEFREVPQGPWCYYGDNNDFVLNRRHGSVASKQSVPTVVTK